jgi:hypothetical protein
MKTPSDTLGKAVELTELIQDWMELSRALARCRAGDSTAAEKTLAKIGQFIKKDGVPGQNSYLSQTNFKRTDFNNYGTVRVYHGRPGQNAAADNEHS